MREEKGMFDDFADGLIEIHQERDKYKKALEEIRDANGYVDSYEMIKRIVEQALKGIK